MSSLSWNSHYTKDKSKLLFPDENLVRMIQATYPSGTRPSMTAADIGSGSGRHSILLEHLGFGTVIATDISHNACSMTSKLSIPSVECTTLHLPIKDNILDLSVCWGSLHYCSFEDTQKQIEELLRTLKTGGSVLGTLRSEHDTFFSRIRESGNYSFIVKTEDLAETEVTFFSENDIYTLFSKFSKIELGVMERTRLGKPGRIAHFFFRAVK